MTDFAAQWRAADPWIRRLELAPELTGQVVPADLLEALLESIESGDAVSANSALEVLADVELPQSGWRRLCAVVRAQRVHALPEIAVAALVADGGAAGCLETVALTAFRAGPEDAEDRLQALSALGRFDDDRVPGWLALVVATGAASLWALSALSHWLMLHGDRLDANQRASLTDLVVGVLLRHGPAPGDASDAWVRWSAVDCACRLSGAAAAPLLRSAWHSGGDPMPGWYRAYLARSAAAILNEPDLAAVAPDVVAQRLADAPGEPVPLPPLPHASARVLARSPRIGRGAIEELSQAEAGAAEAALAQRAAVERALVARGQLIASLLPDPLAGQVQETERPTMELGPEWAPWSAVLPASERDALYAEEERWIAP